MNRKQALNEIKKRVKNKNLVKHMIAAEAIMRELANKFGEDEEKWGLAGLLHDIDYAETAKDPSRHSIMAAEILTAMGLDKEIVQAVKVHNDYHGFERETLMDKALYAADPTTGLIVASALIRPEKKLEKVDVNFVLNRFNEKSFARGAKREQISSCSELGMDLEEFIEVSLRAMKKYSDELEL